jgi:hypothetical protein
MELATFVLKCVHPVHRGWHGVASKGWPHVHHVIGPVVHRWHHVSGPVVRSLVSAQAACRYVPLAAAIAAGGAVLPNVKAPAQPIVAHTTMVASPAISAGLVSAMVGDSGGGDSGFGGGGFNGGFPAGNFGGRPVPATAFAALSPDSLPSDILPIGNFVGSPSGGSPTQNSPVSPSQLFVPPSQTVVPGSPVQPVPEAPSVAMLLSGIALLGLTARRGRASR